MQRDGTTLRIDERMKFAGKTATGTSHATIVSTPFLLWQRSDERGHRCYQSSQCRCRKLLIQSVKADPTHPPSASGQSDCSRWSGAHSARGFPPKASRCETATECRSARAGHQREARRAACWAEEAQGSTTHGRSTRIGGVSSKAPTFGNLESRVMPSRKAVYEFTA
jgi:hypothetical protein